MAAPAGGRALLLSFIAIYEPLYYMYIENMKFNDVILIKTAFKVEKLNRCSIDWNLPNKVMVLRISKNLPKGVFWLGEYMGATFNRTAPCKRSREGSRQLQCIAGATLPLDFVKHVLQHILLSM